MGDDITKFFTESGILLLEALAILMAGIVIIQCVSSITRRLLIRTKLQAIVISFVLSLIKLVLYFLLLMLVANHVGIKTSGFVAIATALSLAISLALKDILSNLVSGGIMITTKPFHEGDYVQINNISGTIKSISMMRTTITTNDNKTVTIPNGQIINSNIVNHTCKQTRRLDLVFNIKIGQDLEMVKTIIADVQKQYVKENKFLSIPSLPTLRLDDIKEYTIILKSKAWVETSKYWDIYYDYFEDVYKALIENKVEMVGTVNFALDKNLKFNEINILEESNEK